MSAKNRDAGEVITLGSGDLMIKEYDGITMPKYTEFTESDLLGRIQGGATLEYKGTWYDAKDDSGKAVKTVITEEEATLKSGILTWNGKTLAKLCATARVTEDSATGIRTVLLGGVANNDGKSYAICFHYADATDGDAWIVVRAVNQGGFSLAFVKDKETVIDAEFKCLPQDNDGTLIQYVEQIATVAKTVTPTK